MSLPGDVTFVILGYETFSVCVMNHFILIVTHIVYIKELFVAELSVLRIRCHDEFVPGLDLGFLEPITAINVILGRALSVTHLDAGTH